MTIPAAIVALVGAGPRPLETPSAHDNGLVETPQKKFESVFERAP
jgi:hypothetical protein